MGAPQGRWQAREGKEPQRELSGLGLSRLFAAIDSPSRCISLTGCNLLLLYSAKISSWWQGKVWANAGEFG